MKAIVISTPGELSVKELDTPGPASGEVLLQMLYVGFCGSDLSTYLGKNPMVNYPRIPGHEISGVIKELGEEVPDGFSVGDAVTVVPYTSCGTCPSCKRGRTYACRENQTLGVQRDGAMQEFIAVPWQKILKASKLNELELAMVEPLTVGFHAIERGRVDESDVVMVLGCGMIGAGAIAGAALRGAKVIAVDIDDHKLSLASALGAQHTINSLALDLHQELGRLTGGDGPDVVVEAAGNPLTYRAAVDEVAFTGRVICIGYAASEVSFATKLFVQKEIDIMGSRNATPEDFKAVISYLEQGKFPLDQMITRKVKPASASRAVMQWADNPGKVMKILVDFKP
ncbi:MAG: zinc-binding alcohol dehydrogenase family protein [Bacteroidales bacterium]|nr:zinc-binding alcohol dehydrogenase family protein [Bacteroidales bacterium]